MKLLQRTSLIYVVITLIVFTAGSFLFYYFLRDLEDEETTEALITKRRMISNYLLTDSLIANSPLADDVEIHPAPPFAEYAADTFIYDAFEKEDVPYRVYHFSMVNHGTPYAVSIRKQLLESDDLMESVFLSFVAVLIILGVVVIAFLQFASKRMWRPFFEAVEQLRGFLPGENKTFRSPATQIREFRELNEAIEKMIANTETSFRALKSFSENAAHEIQTPLMVIQSMTEILRQDSNLTEEQHKTLALLSANSVKLGNIVSTLLLLTRIENKQFRQTTSIDFTQVVHGKIDLLRELFEQRNLELTAAVEENVRLKLHVVLAEVLVSNLLVNALRHTPESGKVNVRLTREVFSVANTGNPLKGKPEQLFERFYKEDQSENSTGLGLSIVKMIADTSGMRIHYQYENGNHVFSVHF